MSLILPGKHHTTGMLATRRPLLLHNIPRTCLLQSLAALSVSEFVPHSPLKMFQIQGTSHIPLAENKFSQQHFPQQAFPTKLSLLSFPSTPGTNLGSLQSAAVYVVCNVLSSHHKITPSTHLHTPNALPRKAPHVTSPASDERLLQQPSRHEPFEVHPFSIYVKYRVCNAKLFCHFQSFVLMLQRPIHHQVHLTKSRFPTLYKSSLFQSYHYKIPKYM